jgi:carbamoyltransferase
VIDHHHCHAANAFYSSNFDNALVFTMDGGGYSKTPEGRKTAHFSAWSYDLRNDNPEKHLYTEFAFSAGLAWWRGTKAVGLPWGSEGTLMAMSALGNKSSHFRDIAKNRALWYPMLNELTDDDMKNEVENVLAELSAALRTEQDTFDFAFELQKETERLIRAVLQPYLGHYQGDVCLAGGTFMNCVAVGKIKQWFPSVRRLYLPPAPYDGGICIGAAQILESKIAAESLRASAGQTRPIGDFSLGIRHTLLDVVSAVRSSRQSLEPCDLYQIAEDLAGGSIIAIFQGSAESGRRALGNRSILADPRSTELKDYLNREVKHRQWYRPFAPMVLADAVQSWFEVDPEFQSPYMSFAQQVKEEKASLIPGVLHCDQSARVQTIDEKLNPVIYRLIEAFNQITGVPVLLNTSFNDREPIVESPSEALATFLRTPIDQLYFPEFGVRVKKNRGRKD